ERRGTRERLRVGVEAGGPLEIEPEERAGARRIGALELDRDCAQRAPEGLVDAIGPIRREHEEHVAAMEEAIGLREEQRDDAVLDPDHAPSALREERLGLVPDEDGAVRLCLRCPYPRAQTRFGF